MASREGLPTRSAIVLYGSETGNAQDVAEDLGRLAQRLRFDVHVCEFNAISLRHLLSYSVVLIAISTTGQGELPANAQTFWRALRSARLRPGCLQQMRFASFGLGDTSYPKFNFAHRKLYNRLVQLGAQSLCNRGESDEQHPEGVDGTYIPWSLELRQRLLEEHPLPENVKPIPDDVLLTPKWELQVSGTGAGDAQQGSIQQRGTGETSSNITKDPSSTVDVPPTTLFPAKNAITATVEVNSRVTPDTHWQDVRHLTLTAEPLSYGPGDVLTIYPKNYPSDVALFLNLTGWTSIADTPLKFVSTSANGEGSAVDSVPVLANLPASGEITLRELLTSYLDIMAIPRRSFFAASAHFTDDETQKERLIEFTNPEYLDELYDYTTRPRRSILEVLQEFETVKLPWKWICNILPALRGRQFSIASGGALLNQVPGRTKIELLVAIVKYRTVIKRIRQGVCTRYITSLEPGQKINVTLQRGSFALSASDYAMPVVLIGPGTGVAPMRSLIYERIMQRTEAGADALPLRNILFYGCRNASADYFFRDEWKRLSDEGKVEIFAAFSRDQKEKIYVQDLIRREADKVYEALGKANGTVYICGSSGKMPQAIREALIEVFQQEGKISREEAEAYLVNMEKSGRYKQETW